MICDSLTNSAIYEAISPSLKKAFAFLHAFSEHPLPVGTYVIDGEEVYASVAEYDTADPETLRWEKHVKYIDIHYIAEGEEAIGWYDGAWAYPHSAYDESGDISFFDGLNGSSVRMKKGDFAVFFPADIHKPRGRACTASHVTKIVVKVRA